MSPGCTLADLDAAEYLSHLETFTRIYAAAMDPPGQQLAGRWSIMERHASYAGFRAVTARLSPTGQEGRWKSRRISRGGGIIAFAYGFHGASGQWWHDLVRDTLTSKRGADAAGQWLGDSFEIAEVHVHPDHQGQGTGRAMMLRLTAGLPERTAVLSTMDADTRARRLYRSLGFTDLLAGFSFPGADIPYAIMGAPLPLRG